MSAFDQSDEIEPVYARDAQGQLVQFRAANCDDYDAPPIPIVVDGRTVEIRRAVQATDERGNPRLGKDGLDDLRYTTLYDAILQADREARADVAGPRPERQPTPVLCHVDHLTPVGVCRVCTVLVQVGDGAPTPMPACCTEVRTILEKARAKSVRVYTHNATDSVRVKKDGKLVVVHAGHYVKGIVSPLIRMLMADHAHEGQSQEGRYQNELLALAERLKVDDPDAPKLRERAALPEWRDTGSHPIVYDRNNCILCNRCIRSCSDVRGFKIIGQAGKGQDARISFDLGMAMEDSECVSCGECMISCPTGALTFKEPVISVAPPRSVLPDEVRKHPIFRDLPWNFLHWNHGAVVERDCEKDKALCVEGEIGHRAFVLREGRFGVHLGPPSPGSEIEAERRYGTRRHIRQPPDAWIVGEMSLINNGPRTASIVPMDDNCRVWEITRDVFLMLQRDRHARQLLDIGYCSRTLEILWEDCRASAGVADSSENPNGLHRWIFAHLSADQLEPCIHLLKNKMKILRLVPGQVFLNQGHEILPEESARRRASFGVGGSEVRPVVRPGVEDPQDGVYVVRSGFVQVTRMNPDGSEVPIDLLKPGEHLGEVALLALRSDEIALSLPAGLESIGRRTATCRAIDHVELVYIPGRAFLELLKMFPALLKPMIEFAKLLFAKNLSTLRAPDPRFEDFLSQGLYQGRDLLLIDLDKCTRCQDCVRACAASHQGTSRLILEGERFDRYLVPSACRSCHDPLCLSECPVDAIHFNPAGRGLSIKIDENRCIGCGLCAENCPFGSIHMTKAPDGGKKSSVAPGDGHEKRLATNCDLCADLGEDPRCVHACPHDAAHRGKPGLSWAAEQARVRPLA